jgi:hypothetical protein
MPAKWLIPRRSSARNGKRIANRLHFWFARTSDGHENLFHQQRIRSILPELCLLFLRESEHQKFLQLLDGREYVIGTAKHPAANLLEGQRRYEVHGNAFSMRYRKLGGRAGAKAVAAAGCQ